MRGVRTADEYGYEAECGAMGLFLFLIGVMAFLMLISGLTGLVFRRWKD